MIKRKQYLLKKYFLLFLLLAYNIGIYAQDFLKAKTNSLSYGMSLSRITDRYKDYQWEGTHLHTIAYNYKSITTQRLVQAGIALSKGRNDQFSQVGIDLSMVNAWSVVKSKHKSFNTYLGFTIGTDPVFTKSASPGIQEYSWINTNTAGLFQQSVLHKGRHAIEIEFQIPLVGWGSRPASGSAGKTSMNEVLFDNYQTGFFISPHRLQAVDLAFRYKWMMNAKLSTSFGYRFEWRQLKDQFNYREQVQGLRVGIDYSFQ